VTRVLFLGDVAQSGFGTVTLDLGKRLLGLGLDVRFISQNDSGEPIPEPLGSRTWPVQVMHPALAIVNGFKDGWKPDACILVGDYFLTRAVVGGSEQVAAAFASIPTLHYCPIEGTGLPPGWSLMWEIISPVAMSEFGADQMEGVLGRRPPVVPHGVDTATFFPISPSRPTIVPEADMRSFKADWVGGDFRVMSKIGAKAFFGLSPGRIYALRTDRNMPRKLYQVLFRTMAAAMTEVENLDLLVHCRVTDQGGNLMDSASKYPEDLRKRIIFTRAHDSWTGMPRSILNLLYNAADLYVSTSAEGFGLTIAESLAAGTPAVALDYSAVSEVVGDAGILIPPHHLIDNEYDHQWATPDEPAFTAAVVRLATKPAERRSLGEAGPRRIGAMYSWDAAARQFAALVEEAIQKGADGGT